LEGKVGVGWLLHAGDNRKVSDHGFPGAYGSSFQWFASKFLQASYEDLEILFFPERLQQL